jgi:hypoxanthine phosphoribosyltransferase
MNLRLHTLPELTRRHLLGIDDILDTGQTLGLLVEVLKARGAASVRVCVLLRKRGRQRRPLEPDYTGFEIPDAFVVGYGLDYNDEHRHLPHIAVLS